jgi:hypothetical protein
MYENNPLINYQIAVNYDKNQQNFNNLTFKDKVINEPRSM